MTRALRGVADATSIRLGRRCRLIVVAVLATAACSERGLDRPSTEPTVLIEPGWPGWQRRSGDSPVDERGRYRWLVEEGSPAGWEAAPITIQRALPREPTIVWMRLRLPEGGWQTPAIHFASLFTAAELYLDGERLATLGRMEAVRDREYTQTHWNVVSLPADSPGKTLYLRVFSYDHLLVGVSANRTWFGDYDNLIRRAVHHQLDQFVLGLALFLLGLFALLLWAKRRDPLYGSFGLFVASTGAFLTLINSASRYFLDFVPLRVYWGYLAFFIVPVGLFLYYQNITPDYQRAARRFWKFHLAFGVVGLAFDLLGLFSLQAMAGLAQAILPLELVVLLVLSIRSARRGDQASQIFNIGFGILGATGLHDLFVSFGWIADWRHLLAWGVMFFVLFLGYLVERRFSDNLSALEESNLTLEHRVSERTQDLNEKNLALESVVEQLRETQQQLLVQEKMASLGNLVAGIAHEINTPVGAVASSADTSARSLQQIEEIMQQPAGAEGLATNAHFQKALRILSDNQRVIETASQRINTIVRGLRNFARLDNAELMEADLHEGLDSTLALVQHKLRDRVRVERDYGELPRVRCHPSRLNQVFMNLLVNATQAIDGSGTIRIVTTAEPGWVSVAIADDGCGIDSGSLRKIFDPGFTTKGVGIGTGLGLSISYQIVRDHGGRIDVQSTPGEGSVFTVVLPTEAPETETLGSETDGAEID